MSEMFESVTDEERAASIEESFRSGERISSDCMVWLLSRINKIIESSLVEEEQN